MTQYKCNHCDTIHTWRSDADTCCADVSEVEICPKCGTDYPQDEYPCCYVEEENRDGNPDKEMWDKWDEENL